MQRFLIILLTAVLPVNSLFALEISDDAAFKGGYIASELLNAEIATLNYIVEKCSENDSKVSDILKEDLQIWRNQNKDLLLQLDKFKSAMLIKLEKEGFSQDQHRKLAAMEQERIAKALSEPTKVLGGNDQKKIDVICNGAHEKFKSGGINFKTGMPKQYEFIMSLDL